MCKKIIKRFFYITICIPLSTIIIEVFYNGFWDYRKCLRGGVLRTLIYDAYMNKNHFFIGANTQFAEIPILPHGLNGIHISNHAKVGRNVTIFQQVTIGSNSIKNHPKYGSPTIDDNVYIGAGAKIIGNIFIGENCRIGANTVVTKDVPPNTTVVASPTRFIKSEIPLVNNFSPI